MLLLHSITGHLHLLDLTMYDAWLTTSWTTLLMVLLTALGMYASLVLVTRLVGLRTFSKMSGFDFAITVAAGTIVASATLTQDPPLVQAVFVLAVLYGIQVSVAILRQRFSWATRIVDNVPLLLMDGTEVLHENLRRARVTEADLRAKLRGANVTDMKRVRAVVFETTGDISVLHADPDSPALDTALLRDVHGAEGHVDADQR